MMMMMINASSPLSASAELLVNMVKTCQPWSNWHLPESLIFIGNFDWRKLWQVAVTDTHAKLNSCFSDGPGLIFVSPHIPNLCISGQIKTSPTLSNSIPLTFPRTSPLSIAFYFQHCTPFDPVIIIITLRIPNHLHLPLFIDWPNTITLTSQVLVPCIRQLRTHAMYTLPCRSVLNRILFALV